MDAQTALGRVYRACLDAAQLNGYDGWFWREVLDLHRHDFHSEWNYTIAPNASQMDQ